MNDLYPRSSSESERQLDIEFTASGSEYFRIWIVNLLLIIVTLGLYFPFAKARRISYFYANTVVDGQALVFHGDPWRMFRGFVLLALLAIVYGVSGQISPTAGLVAFCVMGLVWPALWRSSLIFRMGNTSWRGLRFRFEGRLFDAYLSFLPIGMPLLVSVLAAASAGSDPRNIDRGLLALSGLSSLLISLLFPWAQARIKQYQHGGYAYTGQRTRMEAGPGGFYGIYLKCAGLGMLVGVVAAVVMGIGASIFGRDAGKIVVFASLGLGYLLMIGLFSSYATARLQDLIWSSTHSDAVHFRSALSARALIGLTIRNWLLTVITLSLYRPFAAVQTARLRLSAVTLTVSEDISTWQAAAPTGQGDATGDAAGDFFGFDIGL